jgi:hypothetical protein
MYKSYGYKNNHEVEEYFIFEHEAKHHAIDLAYEGYKTMVYDCSIGLKKLWQSEKFGGCVGLIIC